MRKLNRLQRIMLWIVVTLFLAFVATACLATLYRGLIPANTPLLIGSLMIPLAFALKAQTSEET
jgi:peptidoglycan biosynthesis protein MviN/MurJ (putative lipid II flippase)